MLLHRVALPAVVVLAVVVVACGGDATETPVPPTPTATPAPTPTPTPPPTPTPTPPPFQPLEAPIRSTRMLVSEDSLWAGHLVSRTVTRLALPSGKLLWQTDLGCEPATLALAPGSLLVACFDSGELLVLDDEDGQLFERKQIGHGPFGLLVNGERAYVTLANEDTLVALVSDTLAEIGRVRTGRQPRGLALKGDRLYAVHLLDASVRVYDADTLDPMGSIRIGLQAAQAETITLHPDLERAYVPHSRMNVTNMAQQFDDTVFPVVSVIDTQTMLRISREAFALDSVDAPVGLPVAVALSADGSRLFVVNSASDDISVIDVSQRLGAGHVEIGHHPRDLALSPDGELLYTLNLVSDDITVVDSETLEVVGTFHLVEDPRPEIIQRGERLFLTSRPDVISRDNWMACASCHFDAGFDGQTWLGNEGGPRNTPTLRGIADTLPLHWSADRPDVQSFQQTFTGLMAGKGLSDSELDALAAYLESLHPQPSPMRNQEGSLTERAIQGADVFRRANCSSCHSLPLLTDRQLHDVGTGEPFIQHPSRQGFVPETMGPAFDTPSL